MPCGRVNKPREDFHCAETFSEYSNRHLCLDPSQLYSNLGLDASPTVVHYDILWVILSYLIGFFRPPIASDSRVKEVLSEHTIHLGL